MGEFLMVVIVTTPAILWSWAAVRRAEAQVIWSRRRTTDERGGAGE